MHINTAPVTKLASTIANDQGVQTAAVGTVVAVVVAVAKHALLGPAA